jgi:G:T/U-mismatch repair DNA glycosylase
MFAALSFMNAALAFAHPSGRVWHVIAAVGFAVTNARTARSPRKDTRRG